MGINKCTLTDSSLIHITLEEIGDYTLKKLWQIHTTITKNWMWIIGVLCSL